MIDERARYGRAIAVLRQSKEGPGALAETLDQTGFSQQLEMAEIRGCDWRRMSVRSDTVSSASATSAES